MDSITKQEQTFKISLCDTTEFKKLINLIAKQEINELFLILDSEKINIRFLNLSNTALTDLNIYSINFVEYEVKDKEILNIRVSDLKRVVSSFKKSDVVTLTKENNFLIITKFDGVRTTTFRLGLLGNEYQEQKLPTLSNNTIIEMDTADLYNILNNLNKEQSTTIDFKDNVLTFSDDFNTVEINRLEVIKNGISKSKYSNWLLKLIKNKLTEKTKLSFSKDYPLTIEQRVRGKWDLTHITTPRLDD